MRVCWPSRGAVGPAFYCVKQHKKDKMAAGCCYAPKHHAQVQTTRGAQLTNFCIWFVIKCSEVFFS